MFGWHNGTIRVGDLLTTYREAQRLVDCDALIGFYAPDDQETRVGAMCPDIHRENVVVLVGGTLYILPWPFVAAAEDGRDYEMTKLPAEEVEE